MSTYTAFDNNPAFFIDPSGAETDFSDTLKYTLEPPPDTYGVDNDGNIRHLDNQKYYNEQGEEVDRLYAVDDNGLKLDTNSDGNVSSSDGVTVEKGILDNIENTTYNDSNGNNLNIQLIDVTGSKNTKNLFEFLAGNSTSEFSYSSWFTNSKEIIGTSFQGGAENSINVLFSKYKYLLQHAHSHPDGFLEPSMAGGDVSAAAILEKRLGYKPYLQVYSPFLNKYKSYDKDTAWDLEEVIITVPKKKN